MNEHQKSDEVLLQWNQQVDQELEQFLPEPPVEFPTAADSALESPRIWGPSLLALAACTVLFLSVAIPGWVRPSDPSDSADGIVALTGMYAEVARMFPDQSVWVSMDQDHMEMGMVSLDEAADTGRLVVRVEVQRRGKTGSWKKVWRRDVVTSPNAWVDTVSKENPEEKLSVWTHPVSDGILVMESYLDLPLPYRVAAREQVMFTLQEEGPVVQETRLHPGLRLIQTLVEVPPAGREV